MDKDRFQFSDLVDIYRKIESKEQKLCVFRISSEVECEILNNPDIYGIFCDQGEIKINEKVLISINPPAARIGYLFKKNHDILTIRKNLLQEPRSYYIIENDFFSNEEKEIPDFIECYRTIILFSDLIKKSSTYFDVNTNEAIFFNAGVYKFPILIEREDALSLDINLEIKNHIDKILSFFKDNIHVDQKREILSIAIREVSLHVEKKRIFSYLIKSIVSLTQEFCKGYRLLTSGFTYDKIIDELKCRKIEDIGRIHKLFFSIQNQILGIPLATFIASTQVKKITNSHQGWVNTIIILGVLSYIWLVWIAVSNQKNTLLLIEDEVNGRIKELGEKYPMLIEDVRGTLDDVKLRIKKQKTVFSGLRIGLLICGGLSLLMYIVAF